MRVSRLNDFARGLDCGKVAMGPHGRSVGDTVAFLRTIELGAVEIVGTSTAVIPAPKRERVILRMRTGDVRFDLELRDKETLFDGTAYGHREIAVTPHYVVTEIRQQR